jgi:hypothetical protein
MDGPLGCGENESSGFVVSCGGLWLVFDDLAVRFGLPGCFFWGLGAGNAAFLSQKRGQNVVVVW